MITFSALSIEKLYSIKWSHEYVQVFRIYSNLENLWIKTDNKIFLKIFYKMLMWKCFVFTQLKLFKTSCIYSTFFLQTTVTP